MQKDFMNRTGWLGIGAVGILLLASACGGDAQLFNTAFLNTILGGQLPLTPGPGAAFVFVRVVNDTTQVAEFIVTTERPVLVQDSDGNFIVDSQGNFLTDTKPERKTVRLITAVNGLGAQLGVVFPCNVTPVTVIGLGENLLPTDAAIFLGGEGSGGVGGFGVSVGDLNPLRMDAGNFNCGDTVIFRAFRNSGVPGGVALQVFLLPGSEQPDIFTGPDTFVNLANFLESQTSVVEGP
jgi:hypothetical protein